ncbi:MAG: cytochrome c biogenesis protein ResB [Candidatus Omnitrophica bacterium]|nr:cytochrome c biogenesis protein ResB [Candidatus Omnitrophota bacterium]
MKVIQQIVKHPWVKTLASVKITVVCLFLLFILTFWGTVAQVEQGLYAAQERFFASLIFLAKGFIPFPGAQLVLWVLAVNLLCVTMTRFVHYFKVRYAGILIIHFGLLLYLLSAFVIFHVAVESNIHLKEKAGTNVSSSYMLWELASWQQGAPDRRTVHAYDVSASTVGRHLKYSHGNFTVTTQQFYPNAQAYSASSDHQSKSAPLNASGIALLQPKEAVLEREKNIAGGLFEVHVPDGSTVSLLLYGADTRPTPVKIKGKNYYFILQHKKYPLPLTLQLLDFRAQFHPGTETAKSYESTVKITHDGASREVVISMNNPLTYKDYTFFQASYALDAFGNEYSTFAVVKNAGRFLPYVSSLMTFLGLGIHFLMAAFGVRNKKDKRT